VIRLPWPPSVNRAWRNVGNRTLLSREARAYRRQAVLELMAQNAKKIGGRKCRVEITVFAPDNRRRDIANLEKQLSDAMQTYGVFDDDSQIDDLRIVRGPINKADPHVLVRVEAI
jgi:crossover junction endodeoxyribonuclease RusA